MSDHDMLGMNAYEKRAYKKRQEEEALGRDRKAKEVKKSKEKEKPKKGKK